MQIMQDVFGLLNESVKERMVHEDTKGNWKEMKGDERNRRELRWKSKGEECHWAMKRTAGD